jgi:leucyl aminopeptidase
MDSMLRAMSDLAPLLEPGQTAVPITPVTKGALASLGDAARGWAEAAGYAGENGKHLLVPGPDGRLARVLVGVADEESTWAFAGLPGVLPRGTYRIDAPLEPAAATRAALGWALGGYAFTRYKKRDRVLPGLVWPEGADRGEALRLARAIALARDLVNTPAEDMGPEALAGTARAIAERHGAKYREIVGDALLAENYPAIHAVGRASVRPPRLVDFTWGPEHAPKVTLVGKGVCFDSGGLDLKPSSNMRLMKKDMGGAATVLGLADAVMDAGLALRLRVLVPAVENAVSANSFRPLDVIRTRKGLTVEVGNTDAEGRLILCDALAEADAEKPALLVDCATLTGAARVALGPDLPALFCNDDRFAEELLAAGRRTEDPLWRLPLWQPYRKLLDSKVADMNNVGESPFAGAVVAALYLEAFVAKTTPWAHLDLFAWNTRARPGRPEGGEAYALRALYATLSARFG